MSIENGEIFENRDSVSDDNGNEGEDNCSGDDYDGCDECKISELLKNVSSIFIPFALSSNSYFFFPFLHIIVLEFLIYTALILQAASSCQ